MSLLFLLFLGFVLGFSDPVASVREPDDCTLDFDAFRTLMSESAWRFPSLDTATGCQYVIQGISMIRSQHLQTTGYFSLPRNESEICWKFYLNLVNEYMPSLPIETVCRYNSSLLSDTCLNIENRSQFEGLLSGDELEQITVSCNQPLKDDHNCRSCTDILVSVRNKYFHGAKNGNSSFCETYPFMYAGAFANRFGPTDTWTAKCLFLVDFIPIKSRTRDRRAMLLGIAAGCSLGLIGAVVGVWFLLSWHKRRTARREETLVQIETASFSDMEMVGGSTTFARFTLEEIKKATDNFSRHNIIGRGGYGIVYKGVLADGSEVAFKRFKCCSAAWDEIFSHEVEIIASVKHVNLLALRGYCTVTVPLEGHQRIIVCELIRNGSLYDHLFGSGVMKLSWPSRKKIALGMARGLAYLHYGVQPAIIHRDIKASNVLIDETFEAKLADFGLAKFIQEGCSHLSTKVAGTLGYVAPEYAIYGQVSERSDVYSFGVVLLELLTGKKAVISVYDSKTLLLTDWAWCLVKEGRALETVDVSMPDLGEPSEMEKYILISVLCSHPVSYARPTMDHVVKMLENDFPVPSIPDCSSRLLTRFDSTDISSNSSGLNYSSDAADQQPFVSRNDHSV
ncbi:hypothetical protein TIFTF001_000823 [Ficus carica]|uniref:non-specific serine/threonine protein kinase n=1 Tax=Ficus carica TaxID=3494 RepID=A0AA87Z647_FICCA|nr:hypothetical protein TIFTF001_000823 [Ficus carica]